MVRRALIPVAGLGTRLRPMSSVVPKAMFPLVSGAGRIRPIVHYICAEALAAGIEEIALIVTPGQEQTFRQYIAAARQAGDADVPTRVEYIPAEPRGFGYAIARGADFVGGQPFMIILGDHVHLADPGREPCGAQVIQAFTEHGGAAMIGMHTVGPEALGLVGVARGEPIRGNVFRCTHFVEKPDLAVARKLLRSPGLPEDQFLAHCGIYLFTSEIFQCLADLAAKLPEGKELQLADAQSLLLKRRPNDYYLVRIAGRALDTGTPETYAAALEAMRRAQ